MKNSEMFTEILTNLATSTASLACKSMVDLKNSRAIRKAQQAKAKEDSENAKRIAEAELAVTIQKQKEDASKAVIRKLLATALNEMPNTRKLFGTVSEHSLNVEIADSTYIVTLSSLLVEDNFPESFRRFTTCLNDTVESIHTAKLRELEDFIEADIMELQDYVLSMQSKFGYENWQIWQAQLNVKRQQLLTRFQQKYRLQYPFLFLLRNTVTEMERDTIGIVFEVEYHDCGLNPNNYLQRLNNLI